MKTLLVTTALENAWGTNEAIIFLGEWCKKYDRKDIWENRIHKTVPSHWNDRTKLKTDHDYLKALHHALLIELTPVLNRYHSVDRPLRYWQMILDPWLVSFVAVIWDRWETLRSGLEGQNGITTIEISSLSSFKTSYDYNDYIKNILNDPWNYQLFLEMIKTEYPHQCEIVPVAEKEEKGNNIPAYNRLKRSVQERAWNIVDSMLALFTRRNKVVFVNSYFSPVSLTKLNVSLKQVPRLYRREFAWPRQVQTAITAKNGKKISLQLNALNSFEKFLFSRIEKDIPVIYLDAFQGLQRMVDKIDLQPKLILTANAHWNNEVFKLWSAERIQKGVKFVAMEHGGCIPPSMSAFSFEEEVADIKTTWAAPYHKKHRQLPANKATALTLTLDGKYLGVVGYEMPRYNFRAESAPKAGQINIHNKMLFDLYDLLTPAIKDQFQVRPYPNVGLNTRQQFVDKLGNAAISAEPDYATFLSGSKIIVCTYPQTTFSEAMASGIPSVLVYPKHLWESIPQMDGLLESLTAAGIVFTDAKTAAEHINAVWNDPQQWWNSQVVINARQEFYEKAVDVSDWMKKWTSFIKELL